MTDQSDPKSINRGFGCTVLFALPFAAAGVFIGLLAAGTVYAWFNAVDWIETPCTIIDAKLVTHRSDENDTFEATARYSYTFGGQRFESERVGLSSGTDHIGSDQQDRARKLKQLIGVDQGFRCFVDPDVPEDSVLFRELRPLQLLITCCMSLAFSGTGFGLMIGSWLNLKKDRKRREFAAAEPGKPWLWREDWADGRASLSNWSEMSGSLIFAVFWNLICWPIFIGCVFSADDPGHWLVLFVGAFPLIGIALAGRAIWHTLKHRRVFGSTFEMASVPGIVGGHLSGVVRVPRRFSPADGFLLTLTCLKTFTKKSSDGDETTQKPVWQKDISITRTLSDDDGMGIPVRIRIPVDAEPTSSSLEPNVEWTLEAAARLPGIDYAARFDVPVFEVASEDRDESGHDAVDLFDDFEEPLRLVDVMNRNGIDVLTDSNTLVELDFPRSRNLSTKTSVSAFAIIWTMIGVGVGFSDAPLFLRIVFPATAVCAVFGTIHMWLKSGRLTYSADEVTVQRRYPFVSSMQRIPVADIERIFVENSGFVSGDKYFQRVTARMTADKDIVLADGFDRLADAEFLAVSIQETTNIDRQATHART